MKTLVLITLTGMISACSVLLPTSASLDGEVFYLQRIALPPSSTLHVSLEDVSRADAAATVLAQHSIIVSSQVPVPFSLQYDPARVQPGHQYAVRARIESGGQVLFTTTERHSVRLDGSDTQPVQIRVNPVQP